MEELEEVLKKISNNKASELDNIPGEVWKTGDYNEEILNFCNGVYNKNLLSGGQKDAYFPSPKKETWVSPQTIEELLLQRMQLRSTICFS